MKKIIVLTLCMILILDLAGCGSSQSAEDGIPMASKEEQKAYDAACELMEQGKYSEAADAFANVPLYDAIWSKLNEINRLTGSASADALTGTWFNLNCNEEALYDKHDYYLVFSGNGKVVIGMKSESGEIAYPCSFGEDSVYITISSTNTTYRLNVSQIDGITHIKGFIAGMLDCDFVPAEYYEVLKTESEIIDDEAVKITVTLENWRDYYEIRPFETTTYNSWNEETNHSSGYAIFLKEEYLDRYIANESWMTFYMTARENDYEYKVLAEVYNDARENENAGDFSRSVFGIIYLEEDDYYPAVISDINSLTVVNIDGQLVLTP